MPVTPDVDEAIQEWLEHLGAMNASPHTLRTYRTAIMRLQGWLQQEPALIDLEGPSTPLGRRC